MSPHMTAGHTRCHRYWSWGWSPGPNLQMCNDCIWNMFRILGDYILNMSYVLSWVVGRNFLNLLSLFFWALTWSFTQGRQNQTKTHEGQICFSIFLDSAICPYFTLLSQLVPQLQFFISRKKDSIQKNQNSFPGDHPLHKCILGHSKAIKGFWRNRVVLWRKLEQYIRTS